MRLNGGEPTGDGQPQYKADVIIFQLDYPDLGEKGSLGWRIFDHLVMATKLGRIATGAKPVSGKSVVDFAEASGTRRVTMIKKRRASAGEFSAVRRLAWNADELRIPSLQVRPGASRIHAVPETGLPL